MKGSAEREIGGGERDEMGSSGKGKGEGVEVNAGIVERLKVGSVLGRRD